MSKIAIALFGGSEVEGYSAPVGTHWRFSLAGGDSLDLRRADLPQDHTVQFRFATLFGQCKIRVPKGTKVDLGGFVLFGGTARRCSLATARRITASRSASTHWPVESASKATSQGDCVGAM